jgi:hypothetical protein
MTTTAEKNTLVCSISGDSEEFEVDDFFMEFQTVLNKTKLKQFYVEGFDLDWLHHSGSLICDTNNAKEVLRKIQPNTDDISVQVLTPAKEIDDRTDPTDGWEFKVIIYSHDVPLGSNMYFYPVTHGNNK